MEAGPGSRTIKTSRRPTEEASRRAGPGSRTKGPNQTRREKAWRLGHVRAQSCPAGGLQRRPAGRRGQAKRRWSRFIDEEAWRRAILGALWRRARGWCIFDGQRRTGPATPHFVIWKRAAFLELLAGAVARGTPASRRRGAALENSRPRWPCVCLVSAREGA